MTGAGSNFDLGRDYNRKEFTIVMVGGLKGEHVCGATDKFWFTAVKAPVYVHDSHATTLHLIGWGYDKLTYIMPNVTTV